MLAFAGCASVGHKIDRAGAESIKVGDSKEQVRAAIGKPDGIGRDVASGQEIWTYTYTMSSVKPTAFIPYAGALIGGANTSTDTVTVFFGPDETVANVHTSFSKTDANMNLATAGADGRKDEPKKEPTKPMRPPRGQ